MADSSDHKFSITYESASLLKNTYSDHIWDEELNNLLKRSISNVGLAKIASSKLEGHGDWTSETTKAIFKDYLTRREKIVTFCDMFKTKHISCDRVIKCIDTTCGSIIPWETPECQVSLVKMVHKKVAHHKVKKNN